MGRVEGAVTAKLLNRICTEQSASARLRSLIFLDVQALRARKADQACSPGYSPICRILLAHHTRQSTCPADALLSDRTQGAGGPILLHNACLEDMRRGINPQV